MDRQEAEIQVRERWERLGLEPGNFPNVFGMDVENALERAEKDEISTNRQREGNEMAKEEAILRILNGSKDPEHRCAAECGFDAGYHAALEDLQRKAHGIVSRMAKQEMPYVHKRFTEGLSFDVTGMVTILDAEIRKLMQ